MFHFFPRFSRPAGRWFGVLLLVLAVVAGGRLATRAEAAPTKQPSPDQLKKILADFESYAQQAQKDWQVPGMAIAIVQDNKIIFAKGFGVKEVGGKAKVDKNTIFQIGSASKAFTAALVGMMVDAQKLAWDDKVVEHLDRFQMLDPWVTRQFQVADLMAQHSGLPPHAGDPQAMMGFDRDHIIHSLRYLQPVSSFRAQYAYQNNLFLVAAALVEKYTGKSWQENLQARIFKPLGMTSTTASLKGLQQAKNVTRLHVKKGDKVEALSADWPYHHWVYTYGPAGGLNSNILDMTKWLRLQINRGKFNGKQLVSQTNMDFIHSPKTIMSTNPARMGYYCEAWVYSSFKPHPVIWHNGATSGNKTMVAFMPGTGVGLVVLSNLVTNMPEALGFKFFDLYFNNPSQDWSKKELEKEKKAEAESQPPPRPAQPAPPLPLKQYAGTFSSPIYGRIKVAPQQGKLYLLLGLKKPQKVLLEPFDRDSFTFTYALDFQRLVFTIGPDNRAQSLSIDWSGGGEFQRVPDKPAS